MSTTAVLRATSTKAFLGTRRSVSRIGSIPVRSAATTGRAVQLLVDVLRYSVIDAIALRLPVRELLLQAWTLLKVTAIPGLLMAIPFGAMVTLQRRRSEFPPPIFPFK